MADARCGECGWTATEDTDSHTDLNQAMIDHFYETEHTPIFKVDDETVDSSPARSTDDVSMLQSE